MGRLCVLALWWALLGRAAAWQLLPRRALASLRVHSSPNSADGDTPSPALPELNEFDKDKDVRMVTVNGEGTALTELGPIVVQEDGRVGYLDNWSEMTPFEQDGITEFITKRNQVRLAKLKALRQQQEKQTAEPRPPSPPPPTEDGDQRPGR